MFYSFGVRQCPDISMLDSDMVIVVQNMDTTMVEEVFCGSLLESAVALNKI